MKAVIRMKKSIVMFLMIIICLSVVMIGCSSKDAVDNTQNNANQAKDNAAKEKITLRLAHQLAAQSVMGVVIQEISDKVMERTEGQVEILIFPSGQLGSNREVLEGVKIGTIDMGLGNHAALSSYVPEFGLFDLPLVFRDYGHLQSVMYSPIAEEINQKLIADHGMRMLGWMPDGFRGILSSTPLNTLEDFKKLKIRVPEAEVYIKTFSLLGANPTPMAYAETYSAIETGVVNAIEGGPQPLFSDKLHEVTKYVNVAGHIQVSSGPLISEKTWKTIPEDLQKIIVDTTKEVTLKAFQEASVVHDQAVEDMKKEGIIETKFPEEEMQKMREAVKPFIDEYVKKVKGETLYQQIVDMK